MPGGDLNAAVGELVRLAARVLRRIAAEIGMEGETVVTHGAERRRGKGWRCGKRRRREVIVAWCRR